MVHLQHLNKVHCLSVYMLGLIKWLAAEMSALWWPVFCVTWECDSVVCTVQSANNFLSRSAVLCVFQSPPDAHRGTNIEMVASF